MDIIKIITIILISASMVLDIINCSGRNDIISIVLRMPAVQCIIWTLEG